MDIRNCETAVVGTVRVLTMVESKRLLASHGIRTTTSRVVTTEEEAVAAAAAIAGPVVLKILSPAITHKTDVEGVRVGVTGAQSVARAFSDILAAAARHRPDATIVGVCVEPMAPGGVEVIVGAKRDAIFGPTILFGIGGTFAELVKDVSIRVLPVTEEDIREMISEVKGSQLLIGFRHAPEADTDSLLSLIGDVARWFGRSPHIVEMDLNPVVVHGRGAGATVVDARIVVTE